MYGSKRRTVEIRSLRKRGGKWLKEQREKAGFSQRELAKELKLPYYTFISQVENGTARIPPEYYESWAVVLKVPVGNFVRAMLKYYDPIVFDLLFPNSTSQTLPAKHKSLGSRAVSSDEAIQPDLRAERA
jgi:transcriptional regulator with XRE-family HTH domain